MQKNKVRILLDFTFGPIWKDVMSPEGTLITGIEVIDKDIVLKALNDSASKIYSSLYSFDENEEACSFDKERFLVVKKYLLILISAIKQRLEEINDGSYYIVVEESEKLEVQKSIDDDSFEQVSNKLFEEYDEAFKSLAGDGEIGKTKDD